MNTNGTPKTSLLKWTITALALTLFAGSCDYLPESVKEWQKKQMQKRYGSGYEKNPEKIPEWQEDLKKYEKIIDSKIKAGDQAARLHRKIGESYGESQMYQLCIDHLKAAITLGYDDPDVFYSLGLCEGALARSHNWDYKMTKTAEETFLKVLHLNKNYESAKLQLGLIYFYGFGSVISYRIKSEETSVTRNEFRQKAIELIKEYQFQVPGDLTAYFALGGMYTATGEVELAIQQYREITAIVIKENPETFQNRPEYIQAMENLNILMKKK